MMSKRVGLVIAAATAVGAGGFALAGSAGSGGGTIRLFEHDTSQAQIDLGDKEIAAALVLSIDGVKTQVRSLFELFQVEDLPHNRKRARLVELAFASGAISEDDLEQ